jgi:putative ABC transport system ATP-binding protein
MTLQRNIPELLIGAFAIMLQAVVGFIVVSLYHPYFLVFNLGLIVLLFLVWQLWGPAAVRTAIDLSRAKYDGARWLDHLGDANAMYKSDAHITSALTRSEALTADYIEQEKRHFRQTFAQTLALLFLYALASALLLGIGAWLVIEGQLSLGQLVAAELIMSAIFAGMAQFDGYLRRFYYVCMAVEEISRIYRIPLEKADRGPTPATQACDLRFANVHDTTRNREAIFDFSVPAGAKVYAQAESEVLQRMLSNLLERNETPDHGYIMLAGVDLAEYDIHKLRQHVRVLSRPTVTDATIAEYLQLSGAQEATRGEMYAMLQLVEIDEVVRELPEGLDTLLSPIGLPLSTEEILRMKLAAALWAEPRVLLVGETYDLIERRIWERVMQDIGGRAEMILMLFTRHEGLPHLDHTLELAWQQQTLIPIDAADPAGDA